MHGGAVQQTGTSRRALCCGTLTALCCLPALRAQAALLADQPLALAEVAPGIHVSQGVHAEATADNLGAIANIAFIVGSAGVAVLDSGGCALWGRRLREAIGRVTPLPVRYLVNSHVHPDHIFGNAAFRADTPEIIGHAKLAAALAARGAFYLDKVKAALGPLAAGTEVVPPTRAVADRLEIDLGGRTLRLQAHPTAHTDNDLSVLDLATGTLLPADLLFMQRTPAIDGSLNGWLAAIDALRRIPAARVVPGHGPTVADWPAALDAQDRYLRRLRDDVRAVLKAGGTMEQAVDSAGRSEQGQWRLFDDYNPRNVVTAFAELEWE
ncbi:MAG TPA: quinoprotein relay system zinc metallohydrolase 2 [Methylomirabilota bacterium]|nr:quinoprotein relay system zinc metallohydrolase 2 [Methylomirabilota bacterium]